VPEPAVVPDRSSAGALEAVGSPADAIMRLHARAGNAAVGRMLRAPGGLGRAALLQRQPAPPAPAPVMATRTEVEQALTAFVTRVKAAMTSGTLATSSVVRQALYLLRGPDNQLALGLDVFLKGNTSATPEEFVRLALRYVPDPIPRSRVEALDKIPSVPSTLGGPATFAEAVGKLIDVSVAPLVRKLPIGAELQDKILEAARDAISQGIIGIADAVMDGTAGLDADSKKALHNAIDAAMKQPGVRPAAPNANDANVREQPPSVAPPIDATVPGEDIKKAPGVTIPDTPPPYRPDSGPPDPGAPASWSSRPSTTTRCSRPTSSARRSPRSLPGRGRSGACWPSGSTPPRRRERSLSTSRSPGPTPACRTCPTCSIARRRSSLPWPPPFRTGPPRSGRSTSTSRTTR